ncbi:MAG: hypothetical protein ACP5LJ_00810 [Candidatus Bipolaricaulaceae bacterium]
MRSWVWAIATLFALGGLATELYPESFSCTGEARGDFCWLNDARMYATASWHFSGVNPGLWTLVLVAETFDPCAECGCERDVTLQVFWREGLGEPWNWRFVVLRPKEPGVCQARGELPLRLSGPELWVLVRRAIVCDPFTGFSPLSAHLLAPTPVEAPLPPPPPETLPPPPPPPPPPQKVCQVGPLFSCSLGPVPSECVPPDLEAVPRMALLDTYGPADAQSLELGHYVGEMSPGDYQDWYKFSAPKGEARLVYFEARGDLVVDLYLVHDPCGTDLAICQNLGGSAVVQAPCQAGVECVTIPNGLSECFTGPRCGFFLRIVWRAGSGKYFISILPGEIAP